MTKNFRRVPIIAMGSLLLLVCACSNGSSTAPDSGQPAPPTTSPPGNVPLGAHPRVWVTPERMSNLRDHVATNSVQWQVVKSRADAQLARGTEFAPDVDEWALGDLGMACLMTDDPRYAQRAASVLRQFAVSSNNLQRDWGYDYRHLPLTIMAFDWCYEGLTAEIRRQVATWLMDRADWVWPDTNSSRVGAWGVDSAPNNYFWGFMMTAAAAMAAYGDDVGSGAVSGANRPEYHIELARRKWDRFVVPFITGWASGGVFAEGTNYESTRNIALFADAFASALSDTRYVSEPFFRSLYRWQLQQVTPDGQHFVYLGEQARDSEGSIIYYERTHHLMLTAFQGVATQAEKSISYKMASDWPLNRNSTLGLTALDMIYWDLAVVPAPDLASLPKLFVDPSTGVVVYRTSHSDPDATLLFFEAGPILESHQLFNANGLMVWKRGYWVLGHGQMWDRYYDLGQSSTLFTSAGNQTWQEATGGGGQLLAAEGTDSYLYIAGQGQGAYGREGSRPLSNFLRKVVYLPDLDAFIIFDQVGKESLNTELTWKWWARPNGGAPTASGSTFSFANMDDSATIYAQHLAGGVATVGQTGTGAYFVDSTNSSGLSEEQLITAFRIDTTPNATIDEDSGRFSVSMSNWLVSVSKTQAPSDAATVRGGAGRYLVTDLVAGVGYTVNDGTTTSTVQSSPEGVLLFTLAGSGVRDVTISRQ